MRRAVFAMLAVCVAVLMGSGYHAWWSAKHQAADLLATASHLMITGQGPKDLGEGRVQTFLAVKDPTFLTHNGVDILHPRPFQKTLTQSLADRQLPRRLPGLGPLQEVFYAFALDQELPKSAQLALYLHNLPMGTGGDGQVVTGFFEASAQVFDRAPAALSDEEFLLLLAATLSPGPLPKGASDPALLQRRDQLLAYLDGACPLSAPRQGLPETCL